MTLKYTLALILATLFEIAFAQLHLDWASSTGSRVSDFTTSMLSDQEDNLYILSRYRDTLDLDPGPGVDIAFPTSSAVVALSKFNTDGAYQWSGLFWDEVAIFGSIFEIKDNRLRLVLTFNDSLIYQLHGQNLIQVGLPGRHSCFIDLAPDGQVLSIHYFETPHPYSLNSVITLPNGNTLVGGAFTETLSFSDEAHQIISHGESDAFIAMLDQNLQPIWTQGFGSTLAENLTKIIYRPNDEIYFAFVHEDTIVLESSKGQMEFSSNGNYNSVFGLMDMSGIVIEAFALAGELREEIYDFDVDAGGNFYIGGYFEGTVNFAHPSQTPVVHTVSVDSDGFIAKYNPDGLLLWEKVYRNGEYGGINRVSIERGTDLYISGGTTGRSDLDPGPDSLIVEAGDESDLVVSKLTLDGELIYAYHFYGNEVEGILNLIVSTENSKVFAHGFYYDSLDGDFTSGETWLASAGGSDMFVMGFSEDNVISAVSNAGISSLKAFPNPTSGELFIASDVPITELLLVTIDGRPVYRSKTNGLHQIHLDLSKLIPGIYLLYAQTDIGREMTRVIRQ